MTTYAFIDGGYIRKEHENVLKAIGIQGRIAYDRLVGSDVERTFVYDCLDDIQKKGEDDAVFAQRVAADEGFFGQVENLPGFFMRWGTLTGLPRAPKEEPRAPAETGRRAARGRHDDARDETEHGPRRAL